MINLFSLNTLKAVTLAFLVASAVSCSKDSKDEQTPLPQLDETNFFITSNDKMEFNQGEEQVYNIDMQAPDAYTPVLKVVSRLPEGAVVDNGQLIWAPPCSWGYADGYFFNDIQEFDLVVRMTTEEDPRSSYEKTITLTVYKDKDNNFCK